MIMFNKAKILAKQASTRK